MNRLMKAEWYRARKSSGIIKWLFFITLIVLAIPFLDDMPDGKATASSYIIAFNVQACVFIPMFFSALAGAFVGIPFTNKTAMYEVMAGNKISHIINSKLLVIVPLVSLAVTFPFCLILGVLGIVNGSGSLDNIALRILLLFIITLHVTMVGVLAVTATRHAAGIVLSFLRFGMIEVIAIIWLSILFQDASKTTLNKIGGWFVSEQIYATAYDKIPSYMLTEAILGLVIEVVIWYILSYIGYKKKKFA